MNYILIPKYTYIGASIATVLSEILILGLMMYSISKTEYKPDISLLKTIIKLVICGIILTIVLYLINVSLWLAIPIGLIVYIISLFLTKSIDDTDKYIIKYAALPASAETVIAYRFDDLYNGQANKIIILNGSEIGASSFITKIKE